MPSLEPADRQAAARAAAACRHRQAARQRDNPSDSRTGGGARLVGAQAHAQRAPPARLRRHEAAVDAAVEPGVVAGGEVGHDRRERRRVHAALPAPRRPRLNYRVGLGDGQGARIEQDKDLRRHAALAALPGRPGSRSCTAGGQSARALVAAAHMARSLSHARAVPASLPCREARRAQATSGHAGAPHQNTSLPVRAPAHAHAPALATRGKAVAVPPAAGVGSARVRLEAASGRTGRGQR